MVKAAIVMVGPSVLSRSQKGQNSSKIRVAILSPQMLILRQLSPNKYYLLAEERHFKKNNLLKSIQCPFPVGDWLYAISGKDRNAKGISYSY
ncbi:MAG: hypothetical protein ACYTDW_20100 [Planctomycetota bacterium]|jgi:hypothetical protein